MIVVTVKEMMRVCTFARTRGCRLIHGCTTWCLGERILLWLGEPCVLTADGAVPEHVHTNVESDIRQRQNAERTAELHSGHSK